MYSCLFFATVLFFGAATVAQRNDGQWIPDVEGPPIPYDFQYKVENPPTDTFFGHNEQGDAAHRVTGSYYVYLPDGRLQTVEYTADETGYHPRVSYQQNGRAIVG